MPFNNLIVVIIVIVIMPYFYMLLCYKPITDKLQRRRIVFYCFFTHFLCFKGIRDIIIKCIWHGMHELVTHFLHPKMIRYKIYNVWPVGHGLIAHFLCLKMIRDKCKWMWFFAHYLIIHFLGHWKIFLHVQQDGAPEVIHDTPEFIFKQVNHFYSYA